MTPRLSDEIVVAPDAVVRIWRCMNAEDQLVPVKSILTHCPLCGKSFREHDFEDAK